MLEIRVHVFLHPSNLEVGSKSVARRHRRATTNTEDLWDASVQVARKVVRVLTQRFEGEIASLMTAWKLWSLMLQERGRTWHRRFNGGWKELAPKLQNMAFHTIGSGTQNLKTGEPFSAMYATSR